MTMEKRIFKNLIILSFIFVFSISCVALIFFGNEVAFAGDDTASLYYEIEDTRALSEIKSATVSKTKFYYEDKPNSYFYLPTTFFIKYVGETQNLNGYSYQVVYGGKSGTIVFDDTSKSFKNSFTSNSTVEMEGEAPKTKLSFKNENKTLSIDGHTITNTWDILYLGEKTDTQQVYAKFSINDGTIKTVYGMIDKSELKDFTVLPHKVTIDKQNPTTTPDSSIVTPTFKNAKLAKVTLIICITIPAVLIVVLMFVPNKRYAEKQAEKQKRLREPSKYDETKNHNYAQNHHREYQEFDDNEKGRYAPKDYRD